MGWSGVSIKKTCSQCKQSNKIQFVQIQKRIKIGAFKLINLGSRKFARECQNCLDITELSLGDQQTVMKITYYEERPEAQIAGSLRVGKSKIDKYKPLDEYTRKLIRKDNQREGMLSALLGTVIGILLMPWVNWAKWVIFFFWFGGLYAAFEDPEMKHRAYFKKYGKLFRPKIKKKKK